MGKQNKVQEPYIWSNNKKKQFKKHNTYQKRYNKTK